MSLRFSPLNRLVQALVAASALTLALPASVSAQSIQELYDAARAYDATYLAARALADSAQYRRDQAKALMRPTVGLTAAVDRNLLNLPGPTSNAYANQVNGGVAAQQPLFNRANSVSIDQAERGFEIAAADLETAEQDLIVRLTQSYFDVLAAQDTLTAASANKSAIAEQLASAKRNFEVGTATITDQREAQARFDLANAQVIAAENDLAVKRVALDILVGRQNVKPTPLAIPLPAPLGGINATPLDTWVAQTDFAPVVRKASLGLDIAKLETEKARAGHLPIVNLVGRYGAGEVSNISGSRAGFTSGGTSSGSIGVEATLPIFAGFAVQNRIKETLQLEEQSRNQLEAARRAVNQATRQSYLSVQSGEASVRAFEAAEASNKLALEATQLGFKVGVRVNLDVLNASTQLFATQRDLALARYNVIIGNLRLRQAAGTLKPEDVGLITPLLVR